MLRHSHLKHLNGQTHFHPFFCVRSRLKRRLFSPGKLAVKFWYLDSGPLRLEEGLIFIK